MFMPSKSTCNLSDIAAHLGVSVSTVSRALRGDPRISAEVKSRVLKAAGKLGYRRDAKLSQLMKHVRSRKQRSFQGTLAWLTDHDLDSPHEARAHTLYWKAAVQRASELGYQLECIHSVSPRDAAKISRQLYAKGIQGFVIQQFKSEFRPDDWAFNWARFSIVYCGCAQQPARLDAVDADDIFNCTTLIENVTRLGYQRVGICTSESIERATNHSLCLAQRRHELRSGNPMGVPPCLLPDTSPASAKRVDGWIKRHRVDCIISQERQVKDFVEAAGWRVPQDIGLAWQAVIPDGTKAGVWQREDLIGTVLVESVIAAIEQGRKGLPSIPRLTTIQGTWQPGATCKVC